VYNTVASGKGGYDWFPYIFNSQQTNNISGFFMKVIVQFVGKIFGPDYLSRSSVYCRRKNFQMGDL
jgi:hypothetical protein